MTEKGFQELVRYLEGTFGVKMEAGQRDAYFLTLGQDGDQQILANAVAYARSERARYGLPKPGDLLDHADESDAVLAWQTLLDVCLDLWDSYEFHGDAAPLAMVIGAMGGRERLHQQLRSGSDADVRFMQRDFERLYAAMKGRSDGRSMRIKGQLELHNETKWPDKVPASRQLGAAKKEIGPGPKLVPELE